MLDIDDIVGMGRTQFEIVDIEKPAADIESLAADIENPADVENPEDRKRFH